MLWKFEIPLYHVHFRVIISKDIVKERKKLEYIFGPAPEGDYDGLCSSENCSVAVFLETGILEDFGTISHEVFHATLRVLESVGAEVDVDNQEPAAYLNGHLMSLVMDCAQKYKKKTKKK